jgi:hypothetical protein
MLTLQRGPASRVSRATDSAPAQPPADPSPPPRPAAPALLEHEAVRRSSKHGRSAVQDPRRRRDAALRRVERRTAPPRRRGSTAPLPQHVHARAHTLAESRHMRKKLRRRLLADVRRGLGCDSELDRALRARGLGLLGHHSHGGRQSRRSTAARPEIAGALSDRETAGTDEDASGAEWRRRYRSGRRSSTCKRSRRPPHLVSEGLATRSRVVPRPQVGLSRRAVGGPSARSGAPPWPSQAGARERQRSQACVRS